MKIIVYAHSMEVGGSQLNAIEIGGAVQRLGHEVLLVAEDGPLASKASGEGLEHVRIPQHRRRPSLQVMRQLARLVRHRGIELVHGYEWPPALEAWLGAGLMAGAASFATVMSGDVAPFVPKSLGLAVGTRLLQARCIERGFADVTLIEPPVNVEENSPEIAEQSYRASLGVAPDEVLLVVVCRLVRELKLEGLIAAIKATARLSEAGHPVRLLIVGDGPARDEVESAAKAANASAGTRVVLVAGELLDPRPAYACADVVLGMGSSALRGMAFAKPVVVQGEQGFWRTCDPDSLSQFLEGGWYGIGSDADGAPRLCAELLPLIRDASLRIRLGEFSRHVIVSRFDLRRAARVQIECYERAVDAARTPTLAEVTRSLTGLARYKLGRRWQRMVGTDARDDFNALKHMSASTIAPGSDTTRASVSP